MWLLLCVALIVTLLIIGGAFLTNGNDGGSIAIVVAVIMVFVLLIALPFAGLYPDYSNGVRDGYIVKVSHKGVMFKTWEATMQPGAGQQASLQEPWDFSITDPDVLRQIQSLEGKRVEIEYQQWMVLPVSDGETDYLAVSVKVLPESP